MECTVCKASLYETAKFCPECGTKVLRPVRCSTCGIELGPKFKFCPECGTPADCPAETRPLPHDAEEKSKGNVPATTERADGAELGYKFFDDLKDGYDQAIMITLGQKPKDFHSMVEMWNKNILQRDVEAGIKAMNVALARSLTGILSPDSIQNLTSATQQKAADLLSNWQSYLDRMQQTGDRVLQEVPRGTIEGLIKGASQGIANVGAGAALAGPFGTIGGIAKSLWDGYQMDKQHEDIVETYQNALEAALGHADGMWETLYEHIHKLLKELHGVKTLSLTQVVDLYEKYDENLQEAVEHDGKGRFKDALLSINKAISLCPGETYPYVIKGMALRSLKRWKDLLSAMETLRGLGNVPKYEEMLSYFFSGLAHAELKETEQAIADLRKVTRKGNENLDFYPEAQFRLACCYAEIGDQKKALAHLKSAVHAGYDDLSELLKDKNIRNLANTKEFKAIEDTLKHRVEIIVKRHILSGDQESRVFCSLSEFPMEKLLKAKEHYVSLGKGEKILAIHDSTLFGGAKEGICFTNKAVYWKELFTEPIAFRYADITSIEDSEDSFEINGVPFCCDAKEWHELIAQMLRKICSPSAGGKRNAFATGWQGTGTTEISRDLTEGRSTNSCPSCGKSYPPDVVYCDNCKVGL